jgi:hypothetical protein
MRRFGYGAFVERQGARPPLLFLGAVIRAKRPATRRETVNTSLKVSASLDLVRSIIAAWERGDFGSVEWAHPEIEYMFPADPHPGVGPGWPA